MPDTLSGYHSSAAREAKLTFRHPNQDNLKRAIAELLASSSTSGTRPSY